MKMNIKAMLKSSNNRIYKLLLVLIAGICMLIIVWPSDRRDSSQENTDDAESEIYGQTADSYADGQQATDSMADENYMDDVAAYTERLEKRLAGVLGTMYGISDVQVMITVKDNGQKIALKDRNTAQSEDDDSSQTSVTEDTVLKESGSQSVPYVTKYVQPEIEGVVICCKGAENAEMSLKITNAVQALFDVQAHKIVILEAN